MVQAATQLVKKETMKDYKRLTERVGKGISVKETSTNDNKSIWNAIERLCELEDKIEQGLLIESPKKVYEIGYCYGWEINEKEIGEGVFLTKAEAEERLQELRGGK